MKSMYFESDPRWKRLDDDMFDPIEFVADGWCPCGKRLRYVPLNREITCDECGCALRVRSVDIVMEVSDGGTE